MNKGLSGIKQNSKVNKKNGLYLNKADISKILLRSVVKI